MKGTIYKGAIYLKITLKYNGLEHSFIVVNTNFKKDKEITQFINVCKEFNLYNEIDNSTIFFCGDLNFDIKSNNKGNNNLTSFFKTRIHVNQNNYKIINLYEKFLECTKSINIKFRLPNRIIYAISDKDKYDVYINKDDFYNIKIKNNSSQPIMNSFGFNFVKNNGDKYKKIIENIKKIETVQNLSKIRSIIRNIYSKNHKVLFYINGINNIFEKISGDNFDEFIYWGEYYIRDIEKIKEYKKSGSESEYIEDIYINGEKSKNTQINNLIETKNNITEDNRKEFDLLKKEYLESKKKLIDIELINKEYYDEMEKLFSQKIEKSNQLAKYYQKRTEEYDKI
jgi:hypothetical protein